MKIRRAILDQNPLCVSCLEKGRTTTAQEVDHIIALMKGGTNEPENLQGLCFSCHDAKTKQDKGHKDQSCDESGIPVDPNHHWNT
jgi:5-methylcytosine-specific restriction protein A